MITADWGRARNVFEDVIDLDPADGKRRLEEMAASEPDLAAEVRSLLDHHRRAGEFLSHPAVERLEDVFDEVPSFESGAVVGPYTIDREIGRGGMGRVYLATDTRLARAVALKLLPPSLANDLSQRERLRREARTAATLSHPGISTVYALEELDGHLVIVSEYIDGHSLRTEIGGRQQPSAGDVQRAAIELSDALATAHERGITHRDLKPENIMRARNGRLKILDFGLALMDGGSVTNEAAARLTRAGAIVGTPAYMAPEQLKGVAADPRSDVFALGVVLYEYAAGVHPFEATTPLAMAARVLESTPIRLRGVRADIAPAVADAIDRAIGKAPHDRFASAAEFRLALDAKPGAGARAGAGAGDVRAWWRWHQLTAIVLYLLATGAAWQVKEWLPGRPGAIFLLVGITAMVAGVFRGHLLFAERMNHGTFPVERQRAAPVTMVTDAALGLALFADGMLLANVRPVWSLLIMGLAIGVALARVVVEPATARGAFER